MTGECPPPWSASAGQMVGGPEQRAQLSGVERVLVPARQSNEIVRPRAGACCAVGVVGPCCAVGVTVNVTDEWGVEADAGCAVGAAALAAARCAVGVVRFVR